MAQVYLGLDGLTDEEMLRDATTYKDGLTGNTKVTGTTPSLADYTTLINNAQADVEASNKADTAASTATEKKNGSLAALRAGTTQLGKSVEAVTKGDAEAIKSVGMKIRAGKTPAGDLPAVQNLNVTLGDAPGSNDLSWDILPRGVQSYITERAPAPTGPWTQFYVGRKSSCTATGNASGTEYWWHVCAVGANGMGPWSNPVPKRAT